MKTIEEKFGLRVRELREIEKISQEELAFRCNISKNYISDIERGTRNISLQVIEKIAHGFNISEKELFTFNSY